MSGLSAVSVFSVGCVVVVAPDRVIETRRPHVPALKAYSAKSSRIETPKSDPRDIALSVCW